MNPWIEEIDAYLEKKKVELKKLPQTEEVENALEYIERLLKPPNENYGPVH